MSKVVLDISISLDGYVTGPDPGPEQGLGRGGEAIHAWVMGGPWTYEGGHEFATEGVDAQILAEALERQGVPVVGRRMFEHAGRWGGTSPFGPTTIVVSHRPAPGDLAEDSGFVFVSGVPEAIEEARRHAGGKDVGIGGGASIAQQALRAGLVDEIALHISPVLVGGGTPLFQPNDGPPVHLRQVRSVQSGYATHIWYEVPH